VEKTKLSEDPKKVRGSGQFLLLIAKYYSKRRAPCYAIYGAGPISTKEGKSVGPRRASSLHRHAGQGVIYNYDLGESDKQGERGFAKIDKTLAHGFKR